MPTTPHRLRSAVALGAALFAASAFAAPTTPPTKSEIFFFQVKSNATYLVAKSIFSPSAPLLSGFGSPISTTIAWVKDYKGQAGIPNGQQWVEENDKTHELEVGLELTYATKLIKTDLAKEHVVAHEQSHLYSHHVAGAHEMNVAIGDTGKRAEVLADITAAYLIFYRQAIADTSKANWGKIRDTYLAELEKDKQLIFGAGDAEHPAADVRIAKCKALLDGLVADKLVTKAKFYEHARTVMATVTD